MERVVGHWKEGVEVFKDGWVWHSFVWIDGFGGVLQPE